MVRQYLRSRISLSFEHDAAIFWFRNFRMITKAFLSCKRLCRYEN